MNKQRLYNIIRILREDKFLILIPFLIIAVRLTIFLFIPHTYEDAFITFRYAENLANGYGLVYNVGEKVYGTTVPIFAIFLGFFYYIGIPCITSSLTINLISEVITSLIVYKFLYDFSDKKIATIIALLYIFSPSNISWSIQGMETTFFAAMIALSFFNLYKQKYLLALLFGFLSSIIRIDGLSVPFIIFIYLLITQKRKAFKFLIIPLSLFIIWEIFLYLYFGSLLPNSMIAKLILYSGHQTSIIPNLSLVFSKFIVIGYYSSSIISLFFLIGFFLVRKWTAFAIMVIWFFIYYMALIISRTSIHGWYLIPPLFIYITIAGIGIIFLFNKIKNLFRFNEIILRYILFLVILFFSSIVLFLKVKQIKYEYSYEQGVRMKAGKYLKENTFKNSTIFLEPIGVIGYYSERYIYDDAALISPIFLEFNKLPYNAINRYKKIDLVKPDYLVLRRGEIDDFYSNSNLLKDYSFMQNFIFEEMPNDTAFCELILFRKK